MTNKTSSVRIVLDLNGSSAVTIPRGFGFKKGDHVIVEKLDDNSCKISKIEWNKIDQKN